MKPGGISVCATTVAKKGHAIEENEDAFAFCSGSLRFAVADGASDAAFSGEWARQLVECFCSRGFPGAAQDDDALRDWLAPLRRAWHDRIEWDKLPWYGLEKAEKGAFSSLIGFEIYPANASDENDEVPRSEEVHFRTYAVGDSCLFQVRDGQVLAVSPIAESAEFDSHPMLLASNPSYHRAAVESVITAEGTGHSGDHFVLATDAMAHWLLAGWEQGLGRIEEVLGRTGEEIEASIPGWRENAGLRNDDTTLLTIKLPAASSLEARGRTETPATTLA